MTKPCRIILLLDLDCFYAQCERVRLGLDPETCSLALLQWNSALAVTYPARKCGIKRGDSFEAVAQKSNRKCMAIHLPLLETSSTSTTASQTQEASAEQQAAGSPSKDNTSENGSNHTDDIETAYKKVYKLTEEQRKHSLETEVGRQRFPSEGKACLERYRLASSRIFNVVLTSLQRLLGSDAFVLERASIDELFLDVTEYCWRDRSDANATSAEEEELIRQSPDTDDAVQEVMQNTVLVGKDENTSVADDESPDIIQAMQRGCWVAKSIRQAVWDELGFTLSAGISTSKLVAKLGATFGKPNGQAIIYPRAIPFVMNQTSIRKVRNLGGKLGKQVVAALEQIIPEESCDKGYTMGHVAQHLSVPQLSASGLGPALAQRVFDAARGIDDEVVKETVGALVQSITAFKSFVGTSIESPAVLQWLQLLATDIMQRVQQDVQRNKRYPKSCTVQYTFSKRPKAADATSSTVDQAGMTDSQRRRHRRKNQASKSVRVPFPKQQDASKNEDIKQTIQALLANRAKAALVQREGSGVLLHRIGLAAMDFEQRGSIASYFPGGGTGVIKKYGVVEKKAPNMSSTVSSTPAFMTPFDTIPAIPAKSAAISDEEMARQLQATEENRGTITSTKNKSPPIHHSTATKPYAAVVVDKDLQIARKLQATYDRENSVLTALDKRKRPAKKARIDAFFRSSK